MALSAADIRVEFQKDDGTWTRVPDRACHDAIIAAIAAGETTLDHGDYFYLLTVILTQTNKHSGHTRRIRLHTDRHDVLNMWEFEDFGGNFIFSEPLSMAIECMRALNPQKIEFTVHTEDFSYLVSLAAMKQINMQNCKSRKIRSISKPMDDNRLFQGCDLDAYADLLKAPADILCPITHLIMRNPTRASDGFVYDHNAIRRWIAANPRSPMTGLNLASCVLQPAHDVERMVLAFRDAVINHLSAPSSSA